MELTLTTAMAFIGCVTGSLSTAVHVTRYLKERPKLKFYCTSPRSNVYFPKKLMQNTHSTNDYFVAMEFKIVNASSFPSTIFDILLDIPGFNKGVSHSKSIPQDNLEIRFTHPINGHNKTILNLTDERLTPPIKLEPRSMVQGHIFFLHAFNYNQDIVTGKLIFRTAGRNFKVFIDFYSIRYLESHFSKMEIVPGTVYPNIKDSLQLRFRWYRLKISLLITQAKNKLTLMLKK